MKRGGAAPGAPAPGAAKRPKAAAAGNPLGMMLATSKGMQSEMQQHQASQAAASRADADRKSVALKGRELNEVLAAALTDLRIAASSASAGAAVEVEVRIGMACDPHAEVGTSEAPSRAVPGRRGCGAVDLRDGPRFVPGVSSTAFAGCAERLLLLRGAQRTEYSESNFLNDAGDERLVVASGGGGTWKLERKTVLHKFDYALPSAHYDLRMQCAGEESRATSDQGGAPADLFKRRWTAQRFKHRVSTTIGSWRVDATEVMHRTYPIDTLTTEQALALGACTEPSAAPGVAVPACAEQRVTYELEVELVADAARQWVDRGDAALDKSLADALANVVAMVNPMERVDSRPSPAQPASDEVKNNALAVLALSLTSGKKHSFPGAMPVGFTRRSIADVQRDEYFAAEKSDGERRLLVKVDAHTAVFIDRKLNVDVVKLTRTATAAMLPGTVLDGEVVFNLAMCRPVFLIFDVLHDGLADLMPRNFADRFFGSMTQGMALAGALAVPCRREVGDSAPADDAKMASALEACPADGDAVLLVPKRFAPTKRLRDAVLGAITRSGDCGGQVKWGSRVYRDGHARCHLSDGIVFVPNAPYVSGTDMRLLKWKWRDGLTVDLAVHGAGKGGDLSLHACGDDGDEIDCSRHVVLAEHDTARLRADVKALPPNQPNMVVEVGLDAMSGLWEYHGARPDKTLGNHFDVFVSTVLLHAESPEELELEYRLRFDTKDDWKERLDQATRKAASFWVECFSKSQKKMYWWNRKTNAKLWEKPSDA
mmetsp:Transcript_4795/g.17136  ORF Transcript_4795/g.17136 Transcript_4795/m.17136 type:complete len:769 (-) Transcript_4795:58-2364(-)